MEKMIRFRWTIASSEAASTPPFSTEAYEALYQLSKGNPRLVCKLCHAALLLGYMEQTRAISPELVRKASLQL
jgi:type II secretory pathway predicted ATPase ExeA